MEKNWSLRFKEFCELLFWKMKKWNQKQLDNEHYAFFFTEYFQFTYDFYNNKTILDIGCGPRGSLEWANNTKERIGLDPLVNKYKSLGIDKHKMSYVNAYVEEMPFANNYFDFISAFNSLDHVADIHLAVKEIKRVLKPGGLFLLIVDIHAMPTFTEPQTFTWQMANEYFNDMIVLEEKHLERIYPTRIYSNLRAAKPLVNTKKNGVLTLKLQKK
ncbi:MAG: class I SAM-dependent methyltransferase [Chitinophagaceae bacterium]